MGALASKLKGRTTSRGISQDYEPKRSIDSDDSELLRHFDAENLESYPMPSLMDRLRQLEQLAHVQDFQGSPSRDGYTDDELQQWRHLLVGRRLFRNGEPLVMSDCRYEITSSQAIFEEMKTKSYLSLGYNPASLAMRISDAIQNYQQEILQPRSDMDFDCENLPLESAVVRPGICLNNSFHVDRLMVKANSRGIVQSVSKG